jgi:hypothetical protein
MNTIHQPFAVGRVAKNYCRVIVLDRVPPPIPGPWVLRAIVSKHVAPGT